MEVIPSDKENGVKTPVWDEYQELLNKHNGSQVMCLIWFDFDFDLIWFDFDFIWFNMMWWVLIVCDLSGLILEFIQLDLIWFDFDVI